MNAIKLVAVGLGMVLSLLSVSCGSLPEPPERDLGPQSEYSNIPWNRRGPGEGQALLGGFSQ